MVCFGKSPRLLPSKNYKDWHTEASNQIALQVPQFAPQHEFPLQKVLCLEVVFYAENRRSYDLSNKFESVADLLVDCGVLADDNYSVIPRVVLSFGGLDKEKVGAEIMITV